MNGILRLDWIRFYEISNFVTAFGKIICFGNQKTSNCQSKCVFIGRRVQDRRKLRVVKSENNNKKRNS